MNVNMVIVSQLKKRHAAMLERHAKELAPVEAALAAFGSSVTGSAETPVRKRRKRRSQAQIDAIAKAQAARAAKFAARKAQDGQTQAAGGQGQAARESKPRVPQGPRDVPRGASLAEAAS